MRGARCIPHPVLFLLRSEGESLAALDRFPKAVPLRTGGRIVREDSVDFSEQEKPGKINSYLVQSDSFGVVVNNNAGEGTPTMNGVGLDAHGVR